MKSLPFQFTTAEARMHFDGHSDRAIAHQLRQLGYEQYHRLHDGSRQRVWSLPNEAPPACSCRCHTGSCGANDMDMAERTIRLVEKLRPVGADAIEALSYLVQRAGADYAKVAIAELPLDDEVPF